MIIPNGSGEPPPFQDTCGDGNPATALLTFAERQAVRDAGMLYTHIAGHVVTGGPTRADDLAEFRAAVHQIQRAVLAQAAVRACPTEFRLLGTVLPAESGPRPRTDTPMGDSSPPPAGARPATTGTQATGTPRPAAASQAPAVKIGGSRSRGLRSGVGVRLRRGRGAMGRCLGRCRCAAGAVRPARGREGCGRPRPEAIRQHGGTGHGWRVRR